MKTMKYTLASGALLLCLSYPYHVGAQASAMAMTYTNSQQTPEQRSAKPKSLPAVLAILKEQYQVNFIYQDQLVHRQQIIYNIPEGKKVESILGKLLRPIGLDYVKLDEHNYSIVPKEEERRPVILEEVNNNNTASPQPATYLLTVLPAATEMPQQEYRLIRGRVVDDKENTPIPGATIIIRGTRIGTATDSKGDFSLRIPPGTTAILISYVGYLPQQVPITGNDRYNVPLQRSSKGLNEVVVTGLFNRKKDSYTGAVTTATYEELRRAGNQNIISSLRSIDPTFQIMENRQFGSDPNRLPDLTLRGNNSLPDLKGEYQTYPSQPLFIVDGFEVKLEKVMDMDMNRVASVTILKDATATAIYGSRAANGVVVIETRAPQPGQLRLSITGDYGVHAPDLTQYQMLDAAQKLELERIAGVYTAARPDHQQNLNELYETRHNNVLRGVNTYWLSQPVTTAVTHRTSLYMEGGDMNFRYGVDLAYKDDRGVMKGSGRKNMSGGVRFSYRYNNLLFKNELTVNYNNGTNSPYGNFSDYIRQNPYYPIYDEKGKIIRILDDRIDFGSVRRLMPNPIYDATLNTKNFSEYTNITNNFNIEWTPIRDLRFVGSLSVIKQQNNAELFLPAEHSTFLKISDTDNDFFRKGYYRITPGKEMSYEASVIANYNRMFGKNLLYASAGWNAAQAGSEFFSTQAVGFPNVQMDNIFFAYGYGLNAKPNGGTSLTRRIGLLANLNYSYDNRYLLDLSFRTDGSSQFGSNRRFAPFWSAGAGWNLHSDLLREVKWISRLKLRASVGATGSQNFNSFQAIRSYQYFTDPNYRYGFGAYLQALGNRDLQWQKSIKTNIGTDIVLLRDFVTIRGEYYIENTKALLTDITTAPSIGFDAYKENMGEVQNKGWELAVTAFLVRNTRDGFLWNINAAVTRNKNKILRISNALKNINDDQDKKNPQKAKTRFAEGQSMNAIWAVPSRGIDPASGQEVYMDRNGRLTYTWNSLDQQIVGNTEPQLRGLFGTYVQYKGFILDTKFRFNYGGQQYNQTLQDKVENIDLYYNADVRALEQRWKKPGDIVPYKAIAFDQYRYDNVQRAAITKVTSRFVQDDNTLSCDFISLGYEVNPARLKRAKLSRLKLAVYTNDVFRISTIRTERGYDYPFARTYSFSVNASF